ncbi:bifunctional polysaccharide deacetylase/glycosyltransferase family 2 protein [Longispora sp. K20-0274]|uniref:bifunctional polysaccharide deacetylase/glycosyltransferase family 2 protein n=1 Tax=Longispora sp. K20-0274 TaxID=3088255 RepID=UPI00399A973D
MTARHAAPRTPPTPRAHWVLLLLGMVALLALLTLDGYAHHAIGTGTAARGAPAGAAPTEVTGGGPVIRTDGGVTRSRGMPARTIALTFDDGPDPVWTPLILDTLRRHGAHATFFVVGSRVNEHPELVRRILAEGHELGVHTYTHLDLAAVPPAQADLELSLTQSAIAGATGTRTALFRPPYSSEPGALDGNGWRVVRAAGAAGYLTVLADRDTRDWSRPGADAIVAAAGPRQPGAGAVVLLHDAGGDRSQTVAALDRLLPALTQQGYHFTTVSAGLGDPATTARPAPAAARFSGGALRAAQSVAGLLAGALSVFLVVAMVLSVLRLAVQVWCTRVHRRRIRRAKDALRSGSRPVVWAPVSVIVPAYNESANIAATVRSLLDTTHPTIEIVVVDDGSSDGTADIVEALGLPGVVVVRQDNAGKPAALNTGLRYARHDILVMVDGDTVFEPTTITRLIQPFADPEVGAVSGNTKVGNRRGILGRWQHLEYVIGFNLDRRMFDVAECMPTVPGAIGAFRREVLTDVGGVSDATLAEDTDLTMAVCRAGWRVVYVEDARAWTEAPATLRQLWRQRYRWCYGTLQAMWKHRGALVERGQAGKLGRRGIGYLVLFQLVLPLLAPAVDVYSLYGLVFADPLQTAVVFGGLIALQLGTAAYALRLDREPLGPLWALPLQQLVYRQLMYLVVVQSVATALLGSRLRWHRMHRTGEAGAALSARRP